MGLKWLISILWAFKGALHGIPEILQFNMKNVGIPFLISIIPFLASGIVVYLSLLLTACLISNLCMAFLKSTYYPYKLT